VKLRNNIEWKVLVFSWTHKKAGLASCLRLFI
jgi:hypothetical protein